MFAIESGVTRVSAKRGRAPTATFPLGDMTVSDSFLIPIANGDDGHMPQKTVESWRRKVLSAVKRFNVDYEGEFSTGVVEGGLRVWRTK
jgi:hypothetical protein